MSQFIPALEAAGAKVRVSPFFSDAYLRGFFASGAKSKLHTFLGYARRLAAVSADRADLVWIEKEVFPYLPGWMERLIGLRRRPYVVDYDDAIFHNYDLSASGPVRSLLAHKLDPLLAGSALVTAGNAYLADYAARHGARTVIRVPTVVEAARYSTQRKTADDAVRVGWIGTPANARYLTPVIEAINRLTPEIPLRLVTMGAAQLPGLEAPQESHPWSEATEAEMAASIDIGVMPLTDTPWERGKCGYKLIQYMAAGRPVIASPVGVNEVIVTPDIGFLADSVDEWVQALRILAEDAGLRTRLGTAARHKVEKTYSAEVIAPTLVQKFAELIDRGDARECIR
ncbi:glycosyltransferase family 4 protein [Sphingomonas sp. M1-B02]|uniref:glycosyltransferase family 4 protein n=1 Tax=Sphingomonas sp. M1-B02 TaxID=3114300 RepID=UPI00223F66FA|nr:glycosyltransferase family 4 protein [Sphingomonas sp. S6-11]UZK65033.1 glycosyltransferase family 4 protein [Sphingomonas sp. S6-11]